LSKKNEGKESLEEEEEKAPEFIHKSVPDFRT
jgi:hypothetical protein